MTQLWPLILGQLTWHEKLVRWTEELCIVLLIGCVLACVYRAIRGPHLADRALAVDTISVQVVGLVTLLTMRLGTLVYFDGILVLSLLGLTGTVAIAQYIARPHMKNKKTPLLAQPQPNKPQTGS